MRTETGIRASWSWLLALYTIAGFFETVFWGQLTAFTPLYLPRLGIDPGEVARWTGLIAALTGAAGLPFLPFWGALADRFSRQPVIVRSFVVYLLAGTLALLAGNVWVFTLGRAVMSLALGNSGLMMTTLSERTPPHRQGLAFAIMNSAGPVGVFLGPLVGGPVVDHWGFRALLAINIAIMVVVVMTLSFGYRDAYRGASRQPILTMAVESVRIILRSTRLRSLFVAFFFLYAGWMLALTYLPLVVGALYSGENEASAVGLVLGGGGLVALVLGPFFGWLADRYGHWRVLQTGGVLAVILWPLPGLVGWGVQLQSNQGLQQGAAQPGSLAPLLAFGLTWAIISGLASGIFSVSFSVLSGSAPPDVRGRVMSFAYLPVNLGYSLGPAIGSLFIHTSLFAIFPVASLLTLIGLGLLVKAKKT